MSDTAVSKKMDTVVPQNENNYQKKTPLGLGAKAIFVQVNELQ